MGPLRLFLICCAFLLAGCSTAPSNPQDPYESFNRHIYSFNEKADTWVLKPAAKGYRAVTAGPVRTAVGNFFDNIRDVYSGTSNLLRADPEKTTNDFMRFAINTTFGIFGLIDIATPIGLKNNKNTLGDTFASWGWKNSNYLMLPFFGPSTLRDGTGFVTSFAIPNASELVYSDTTGEVIYYGLNGISSREKLLGLDEAIGDAAIDPYVYIRDGFLQLRARQLGLHATKQDDDIDIDELVAPSPGSNTNKSDSSSPVTEQKVTASQAK